MHLEGDTALPDPRRPARLRGRLHGAAFLMDAVGYSYPVMASAYAQEELLAGPIGLGILGFVSPFVYAMSCLAVGRLSDRVGSMPLIRWGILVFALAVLPGFLLAGSLPALYAVSVIFGTSIALFWTPLIRQLALLSPGAVLWRSLGVFNICWALGATFGSIGGPYAYRHLGRPGAAALCAALAAGALVVTAFRAPPAAVSSDRAEPLEEVEPRTARRFLLAGWISNFVAALASGALQYLAVYVARELLIAEKGEAAGVEVLLVTGLILFAKETGRFIGFALLRYWSGWHYSLPWLCALQLAGGGALVAAGVIESVHACVALVAVFGVFSGLSYYSSVYYSMNMRSNEGLKSGIHEGILAFGIALGPPSCGAAGYLFPARPGVVLYLAGAFVLAGLGVQLSLFRARLARREGVPSGR